MAQTQAQKQAQRQTQTEEVTQDQGSEQQKNQQLVDDVDALLEEIDGVLEENADEFVRSYIQKGGEASRLSKKVSDILVSWTLITGHALSVVKKYLSEHVEGLTFPHVAAQPNVGLSIMMKKIQNTRSHLSGLCVRSVQHVL